MPEFRGRDIPLDELVEESFAGEWGTEGPHFGCLRAQVVRSTEIQDDGRVSLNTAVVRYISADKVATKSLRDLDILVEAAGGSPARPVGRPAMVRIEEGAPPVLFSNFVKAIRFDRQKVTHPFAIHALRHLYTQPRFGITQQKTTGIINLNFREFLKLSVWVPPDHNCQALIADILDVIDDAILETDALIEKYHAIWLGLLDDLIAKPAQVGRSEAPDTLADLIASIVSGCSVNADDRPPTAGEFGVLKTSAVGGGRFRPHQSKAVWQKEEPRLKCPVTKGTIIFNRKNTPELVGGSAYVERDYPGLFLPDLLWSLRVEEQSEVIPAWVATLLQTRPARAFVTRYATGTSKSMVNISQPLLLSMPLRKLPKQDQADAMKAISALQTDIDTLTSEREKLAALRLGLREDLLTGRKAVTASREAAE
ncbi:restriction endonuclease subunit S [Neorhizobium galegae]|uniref:restriction endonuclease subunit S n=1 Tax=Neorhizobium galegae TaxID=399 RepID=UPI0006214B59|nr:restriction endonuclease subunit S [Neorhizobium galegae]CDZ54492.1 Putative restriction-modification system specificity determinant [Neorhizobium galegae bv. orientalis]